MIFFDIRTIVFSYVVTNIICVLFIVLLWRQSRDRFAGLDLLAFDFILQTVALVLIVLRGAIPDWMSIVLSNTMIITGALLGFLGYEHFVGKKGPQTHNYVLVTFFILVQCYFFFVQPSLTVRSLNISLTLLLICFQSVWLMWHRIEPGLRSLTFGVGLVNFLYCLDSIFRIIKLSIGTYTENNYFQSGTFEALALIVYQLLFIMLTYSIIMMVNRRLLMEIGTQEEKFSKAFHSVPYAIMLTRLSDGLMFEVNDGFANITGYHYDDAMGKTTIDLRLWVNEEDRIAIVSELTRHKRVRDAEYQFRKKSGEIVFGLFSAEIIQINDIPCVLSVIIDITERKYIEEDREKLIRELKIAVSQIKKLSGLLPICSHCKKIRDDKGYWNSIESYIHEHSEAEFSHGICQECAKKYYPDMDLYDDETHD